ncbi:MAG: phosphate ABC transporter ATP-binding protein [Lentisphaerae bacterium]|nr:phosphate ABC transporter ATP-binding protein [Lentisphaerota bacterium]
MNADVKIEVRNLDVFIGNTRALRGVTIDVPARSILGIIGPAGSGKTVFLRTLNRLNDLTRGFRATGRVLLDGADILAPGADVVGIRKRVGMLFALPVPLPMSIFDNVAFGPRLAGTRSRRTLRQIVESSLKAAFLWEEVKDRLNTSSLRLSGGQQQRLCLARVLAMEPEVILLDEPCSGLDPVSTARIEEALAELKARYTIILVTNNTKQAARVACNTAFFLMGELVEVGPTSKIFISPSDPRTNDYVIGKFG